jgi:hypothetical protein
MASFTQEEQFFEFLQESESSQHAMKLQFHNAVTFYVQTNGYLKSKFSRVF